MNKPKYCVEMKCDEEDSVYLGEWYKLGLTLCYAGENCGCYAKGNMDNCDEVLYETVDIELARERLEAERQEGHTVRLRLCGSRR